MSVELFFIDSVSYCITFFSLPPPHRFSKVVEHFWSWTIVHYCSVTASQTPSLTVLYLFSEVVWHCCSLMVSVTVSHFLLIINSSDLFIDSAALLLSIAGTILLIDSISDSGALLLIDSLALGSVCDVGVSSWRWEFNVLCFMSSLSLSFSHW